MNRLVHPHMLVLASNVTDVLNPIVVTVKYENTANHSGIRVVHGQVLDAVVLHRQSVVPPRFRRLIKRDVRHPDARRYADCPRPRTRNGGYNYGLLLSSAGASIQT